MASILEAKNGQGPASLDEIETHVAWLYATAVRVLRQTLPNDDEARRLIRRVLIQSEVFQSIVDRIEVAHLDADLAVDIAGVLTRALDLWKTGIERWRDDARSRALAVSAGISLTSAKCFLMPWASAPWVYDDVAVKPALGHPGQKTH